MIKLEGFKVPRVSQNTPDPLLSCPGTFPCGVAFQALHILCVAVVRTSLLYWLCNLTKLITTFTFSNILLTCISAFHCVARMYIIISTVIGIQLLLSFMHAVAVFCASFCTVLMHLHSINFFSIKQSNKNTKNQLICIT